LAETGEGGQKHVIVRCLPDDNEDRSHGQQNPLVGQVLPAGVLNIGGQDVALHPAVVRAHQEDEPEEDAGEEPSDVREVVDVREDADGEVDRDHHQEGHQCCGLVRVDGPVGEELRQHGSEESEQGARRAD
jgi:hypothetical protein